MQPHFTKDDQRALIVTIGSAVMLLGFSLWFTIDMGRNMRPSFIEVEFGEFQTGRLTQFSEIEDQEVATRPNPSEVETDEPAEDSPETVETPEPQNQDDTKPVDLPDEVEDVIEEPIETPVTDEIDPTQTSVENTEEEIEIAPLAQQDVDTQEGADESGDVDGAIGETDSDQGIGTDDDKTAPYELSWEGDIERAPMVQPLPTNNANTEAVITVRFEVRPNGTVGRIIPLRKMNPELETEVMSTLRTWRFSRLPGGVPQTSQWGTITFRFVFD
jgi:TonB family protein